MIFTRRYIQNCINGLGDHVSGKALATLVGKLNMPNEARLPAMWEVVILNALSLLGRVDYEKELPSGRTPDVTFTKRNAVVFTADVTTISDSGLAKANPVQRLKEEIEACKTRLGLPTGGLNLKVGSERVQTNNGPRTVLLLPPQKDVQRFVREMIERPLRARIQSGQPLSIAIDEPGIRVSIQITGSRYNSISHAAYDMPEALTRNPLYNALHSKKKQLRTSPGITGIIVCDGASRSVAPHLEGHQGYSPREIATEFLRRNSSIHFVLVVGVDEKHSSWPHHNSTRQMAYMLQTQPGLAAAGNVETIFRAMAELIGQPERSATNAAFRAQEPGYGWGHHGGFEMSASKVRLSSRMVMEVLSGRRTAKEMNELQGWRFLNDAPDNATMPNPFEHWLDEGRLPVDANVKRDDTHDDDWIEFDVGKRDAAVSDFVSPAQGNLLTKLKRWTTRFIGAR